MDAFLKTWYGMTLFILFDTAAVLAVLAIGYRLLFKRLADIFFSALCMTVLSPLFLVVLVCGKVYRKRTGRMKSLIAREFYVGKKAKNIVLHLFCTTDDDGAEAGRYGRWLRRTGVYKLPYLADVFCGRLSFLGVRRFTFTDAAFVEEEYEDRFSVRPGFINPLAVTGKADTDYKEMLASDVAYAKNFGLFGDWKIFFVWLLKKIRGEGRVYFGKTDAASYAETLLAEGAISQEDFDMVVRESAAEIEELEKSYERQPPEGEAPSSEEEEPESDK